MVTLLITDFNAYAVWLVKPPTPQPSDELNLIGFINYDRLLALVFERWQKLNKMNIVTIILAVALMAALLWALYHRGNNKIRTTIHAIESVLNDNTMHINERVEEAKSICRNTNGIVFYGIYCALDAISRALANES